MNWTTALLETSEVKTDTGILEPIWSDGPVLLTSLSDLLEDAISPAISIPHHPGKKTATKTGGDGIHQ